MSANKLDQFFKGKLENAPPAEFNPQHWEAAKLLLKDEKKNHKIWWLFLLGTLIALSLGLYFFLSLRKEVSIPQSATTPQEMAQLKFETNPEVNNSAEVISPEEEQRKRVEPIASEVETKKRISSIDQSARSVTSKKESNYLEPALRKENIHLSGFPTTPSIYPESIAEGKLQDKEISQLFPGESVGNQKRIGVEAAVPWLTKTDVFLAYHYALSVQKSELKITREKFDRRRYAWSGTLLLNPANTSGSTVQGLLLGFTYERYLRPHWFLGTKPSLQLQTNQNGFSKFEQVTSYSFSAINTTYGLQADNLQFFSAPIYLAAETGRHTLELGVSLDLLLGARGKLQQISVEDQSVSTIENLGSGWIEIADMRKLSTNLFLGYKTSINPRLKTGITFFYNPAKLYPGLPNNLPQVTNTKWYLGWQANYYVK